MDKKEMIGPFRIPKEHKDALAQLKAGKAHITMSDLFREAVYSYLVKRGVIIEVNKEEGIE